MKKITIGRGRECDIRLDDSTDTVSRRQAVITVTPFGKMEIYDTSSNGTFVNGQKVEKPNGMPLKRGDKVNFAHVADLDWDMVKDPYRKTKVMSLVILLVAIVTAVIILLIANRANEAEVKDSDDPAPKEEVNSPADEEETLTLQVPAETRPEAATPVKRAAARDAEPKQKQAPRKDTGKLIDEMEHGPKADNPTPPASDGPGHDPALDDAMKQR